MSTAGRGGTASGERPLLSRCYCIVLTRAERGAAPIAIIKAGKTPARRYAVLTTFMAYVTLPAHKINVPPLAPLYSIVFPD